MRRARIRKSVWMGLGLWGAASLPRVHAADPCQYFLSIPIARPDGSCSGEPGRNAVTGGALPSFSDAFNLNPASLPTISTPHGVEAIMSRTGPVSSRPQYNVALLKGYQRFGLGLSTNSDRTFYAMNLLQAFEGTEYEHLVRDELNAHSAVLNLGGSYSLSQKWWPAALGKITKPALGFGLRYNQVSETWNLALGLSLNTKLFSFGVSTVGDNGGQSRELSSRNTHYSLGLKIPYAQLEYSLIHFRSTFFKNDTHIGTLTFMLAGFSVSAAYRTFDNIAGTEIRQGLGSAQYQLNRFLTLAYFYNYVRGAHSAALQLFL